MTINEVLKITHLTINDIKKVYHGTDHACRCGCCGNYFVPGDKGFTRAINAMNKPEFKTYDDVEVCESYINFPVDYDRDKCYTIYFK